MPDRTVNLRLPLPADQVRKLNDAAERLLCRRSALLAKIVAAWLANPSTDFAQAKWLDGHLLSAGQLRQLRDREKIVLGWRKARRHLRHGQTIDQMTAEYVASLKPAPVTRGTIWRWALNGIAACYELLGTGGCTIEPTSNSARSTFE